LTLFARHLYTRVLSNPNISNSNHQAETLSLSPVSKPPKGLN
jgi:hypothetical protein